MPRSCVITTQAQRCFLRYLAPLIVVVTAVLFSGCIRVKQELALKPDGTGTMRITYGVKEDDIAHMKDVSKQMASIDPSLAAENVNWLLAFDEETIRREWNRIPHEGVRLITVTTERLEGWRYMHADIGFQSLQKLIDCGMVSDCRISLTRGPNGQYGYLQSFDVKKAMKSLPPGMDIESLRPMVSMMMEDFRGEFIFTAPGRIMKSNADRVDGGLRATWVIKGTEPDILDRLEQFDLRLIFDGRNTSIGDAHL